MLPILYIVIPCYNEQEVLPITAPMFRDEIVYLINKQKISPDSKVMFVNDGSRDNTWEIICALAKQDPVYAFSGAEIDGEYPQPQAWYCSRQSVSAVQKTGGIRAGGAQPFRTG